MRGSPLHRANLFLVLPLIVLGTWSTDWRTQAQQPGTVVVSPEISADRKVVFRLLAPNAKTVRLSAANDLPDVIQDAAGLVKAENGVWEITVGPLESGAYRYAFNVDGVQTLDPRNLEMTAGWRTTWSVVYVPGSELWDTRDVPHGAVAKVTYKSTALGSFRRMHVYTPPGYEAGTDRYPVLYLLHGGTESDEIWSSVGRANFILDNLIAAKKAKPMIIAMPMIHPSRNSVQGRIAQEQFATDFNQDVMPYIEKHYRVLADRVNTAIAGLSAGGAATLNVFIPRVERFGYVGVFSWGLFGAFRDAAGRRGAAQPVPSGPNEFLLAHEWEERYGKKLDDPALKKGLRLLWFATGKDDEALPLSQSTVDFFKKHGFAPVFRETPGRHLWTVWRSHLAEFAPQLFR